DGRRIFAVSGQKLHAAVIQDDEPHLVGSLSLGASDPQLMLVGDRLIVVGNENVVVPQAQTSGGGPVPETAIYPSFSERTIVQIVDVSNPAAMRVASTLHLEGGYIASRTVAGVARIVVRRSAPAIGFVYPQDSNKATLDKVLHANREAVTRAGIDKWIPRYQLERRSRTTTGTLPSCS